MCNVMSRQQNGLGTLLMKTTMLMITPNELNFKRSNCPAVRHLQSFERQSPTLDGYPDVREGGPQLGEEEKAFIQRYSPLPSPLPSC